MAEYEKNTNGILPCCCDFWIQKNQANKKVVRQVPIIGLTFGQKQI